MYENGERGKVIFILTLVLIRIQSVSVSVMYLQNVCSRELTTAILLNGSVEKESILETKYPSCSSHWLRELFQ